MSSRKNDINHVSQEVIDSFHRRRNKLNAPAEKKPLSPEAKAYYDRVNNKPPLRQFTELELKTQIIKKLHKKAIGGKFTPSASQKALMKDLYEYFSHGHSDLPPLTEPLDTSKGICLVGSVGIGKTEILKSYVTTRFGKFNPGNYERTYRITTATDLVDYYGDKGNYSALRMYFDKDLYIIDVGTEPRAKYDTKDEKLLTRFIHMWDADNHGKKLYMCTNLTKEEMMEVYGARAYSRLCQLCNIVKLSETTDYRRL